MRRHSIPRTYFIVGLVTLALGILPASAQEAYSSPTVPVSLLNAHSEILWDTWGVPHIFADDTDSLFYAYGYAQMHSHGDKILRLYGIARGRAAEYWGDEYLTSDRFFRTVGLPEAGREGYAAQTPQFRGHLDAFADGVNAYAREHPDLIADDVESVLPVDGADMVGHMHRVFFTFLALTGDRNPQWGEGWLPVGMEPGSNAWAVAPGHTENRNALLLTNPHIGWDVDLVLLYEAQLAIQSEGIDNYGATIIGLPVLVFAFNDSLGWTHTVNTIDGFDTYALALTDNGYRLDGEVRAFETEQQTIRVRQDDGAVHEEPLLIRRSVQGPVIATADGATLAVRQVGLSQHGGLQQWWDMGRARSLAEFEAVLRRLQLPMFTVMYADRDGHVLSLFGGRVPVRPFGNFATWQAAIPGDTSATLWSETHPYDDLPRVVDPPNGWVQNSNSQPWYTSIPRSSGPEGFPPYMAPGTSLPALMREQRAIEMLSADERISLDDLVTISFSTHMALTDRVLDELISAARNSGRQLAVRAAEVLQMWNRAADADSRGAVLFVQWARGALPAGLETPGAFASVWDPAQIASTPFGLADPVAAVAVLEGAAATVEARFGDLAIAWGDVNRLRRNEVDLPGHSAPGDPLGVFSVIDYAPSGDGLMESVFGVTYVSAVEFTPQGARAKSLTAYGNATQTGSPHNGDQLALLAHKEMRPVWRTRSEIGAHLEAITAFP